MEIAQPATPTSEAATAVLRGPMSDTVIDRPPAADTVIDLEPSGLDGEHDDPGDELDFDRFEIGRRRALVVVANPAADGLDPEQTAVARVHTGPAAALPPARPVGADTRKRGGPFSRACRVSPLATEDGEPLGLGAVDPPAPQPASSEVDRAAAQPVQRVPLPTATGIEAPAPPRRPVAGPNIERVKRMLGGAPRTARPPTPAPTAAEAVEPIEPVETVETVETAEPSAPAARQDTTTARLHVTSARRTSRRGVHPWFVAALVLAALGAGVYGLLA